MAFLGAALIGGAVGGIIAVFFEWGDSRRSGEVVAFTEERDVIIEMKVEGVRRGMTLPRFVFGKNYPVLNDKIEVNITNNGHYPTGAPTSKPINSEYFPL